MSSREKAALQLMAAKYEKYGISFIDLLRMFGQAPPGQEFIETYKRINAELKAKYIK